MNFDFGANKRSNSFGFGAATSTTPSTPTSTFGFGSSAPNITPGTATPGNSFGFGAPAAGSTPAAPAGSFGFGTNTAATLTSQSTGFGFGSTTPSNTTTSSCGGLGTGAGTTTNSSLGSFGGSTLPQTATSLTPSNQLFSSSVPAQTSTGIPYPKETKFADLAPDVQKAIQSLETTIRAYEASTFQVPNRRYEKVDTCAKMTEELECKIQVFEFAVAQNHNRMLAAKRNLGKYWKYGENVARQLTSIKPVTNTAQPAQPPARQLETLISSTDLKFFETIINDLQQRSLEMEGMAFNVKNLLEQLQVQPAFTVQGLKNILKCHTDALMSLAEKTASFHEEVRNLRNIYREFNVLYRHDSRDPFASKYTPAKEVESSPAAQPSILVAPKINSMMGASQPAPMNFLQPQAPTPAAPSTAFSFPSSSSFLKKI